MSLTLCILLWPKPGHEATLIAYEDRVLGYVGDHGGRVVQRARVRDRTDDQPIEIQLLDFPSQQALDDFLVDDRRVHLTEERDSCVAKTEILRVDVTR